MTFPSSHLFKVNKVAIITAFAAIAVVICCAFITGFRYERKKFKAFLATIALALVYQIFVADVVLIFLKGAFNAFFRRHPWSGDVYPFFVGGPDKKEYLRRRITTLKKQLELGPTFYQRNEAMTLRYKQVLDDLLLFGGYLLILLVLVSGTRDTLMFYHTRTLKHILKNPIFSDNSIDGIVTSDDLYEFINGTIIQGLINSNAHNGEPYEESGWTRWQIAKILGIVRLRQIRLKSVKDRKTYESSVSGPVWSEELASLPYKGKFWRIFQPWEYQSTQQTADVDEAEKIYPQPRGGYVTLLGRNTRNSHRVLNFLHDNDWIDSRTAIVIIDFTLYNVDADIFNLVKITAEQTAFNSFVTSIKISAFKLLFNIDNLPWYATLSILLYFLIFMRVLAYVVLGIWFSSSLQPYFSGFWNKVDAAIVVLNLCIFVGLWIRELLVKALLLRLETSRKNEYIAFSQAAFVDEVCTVMIAFLVAITTVRLWKILQFARVFRMLTRTLYQAKSSLSSTTFFIFIFIMGMGLSSFIINGSNSPKFMGMPTCISSLMSLSFGFTTDVSPSDLNYGGNTLGFMLYSVLVVAVSIFLVNMFITVLCLQFAIEKQEDKKTAEHEDYYTFWHFLAMEISEKFEGSFLWRGKNRTETQAGEGDADVLRLKGGGSRFGKPKVNRANANGSDESIRRLQLISEILETQMELLSEVVEDDEDEEYQDVSLLSEIVVTGGQENAEYLDHPSTSNTAQPLQGKMRRKYAEEQLMTNWTGIRSP